MSHYESAPVSETVPTQALAELDRTPGNTMQKAGPIIRIRIWRSTLQTPLEPHGITTSVSRVYTLIYIYIHTAPSRIQQFAHKSQENPRASMANLKPLARKKDVVQIFTRQTQVPPQGPIGLLRPFLYSETPS